MAGQSYNRYGDRGRMPTITEGVTAPTTTTAGQLGDVVFDTDGVEWTLKKIVGGTHTWLQTYPEPIMMLILSEDQTTGLASGGIIKFDTAIDNMIIGASIDAGVITLPLGKYRIDLAIRVTPTTSSGVCNAFINVDAGSQISHIGLVQMAINSPVAATSNPVISDIITLTEETDIVVQFGVISAMASVASQYTEMIIRKVG